jgi:hypothetical protein
VPSLALPLIRLGSDARRDLKDHSTVKPAMLEDALLDLTNRCDMGSGSTLIAADKTAAAKQRHAGNDKSRYEITTRAQ